MSDIILFFCYFIIDPQLAQQNTVIQPMHTQQTMQLQQQTTMQQQPPTAMQTMPYTAQNSTYDNNVNMQSNQDPTMSHPQPLSKLFVFQKMDHKNSN